MKLLIDNALSPRVAEGLIAGGYQALHVGQLGMAQADDERIFHWCYVNDYVVEEQRIRIRKLPIYGSLSRPQTPQ